MTSRTCILQKVLASLLFVVPPPPIDEKTLPWARSQSRSVRCTALWLQQVIGALAFIEHFLGHWDSLNRQAFEGIVHSLLAGKKTELRMVAHA